MKHLKLKPFSELKFSDSFLFGAILEDEALCQEVLCRILEIPVKQVKVRKESMILINPEHRGIRMDVFADDEQGTIYDVEMQTTHKGNLPKRSRCYQGQMDVASLEPGDKFNQLPRSYIIFLCTFDPFGRGRYRYTYVPTCKEDGELLENETCRIFLNTKGINAHEVSQELISFLHFVEDGDGFKETLEDGLLQRLNSRIAYLKHSRRLEERYMLFGEILDDERKEGHLEGLAQGLEQGLEQGHQDMLALIKKMCDDGRTAEITKLSTDQEFLKEMLAVYAHEQ